jgi:hypothetical protein
LVEGDLVERFVTLWGLLGKFVENFGITKELGAEVPVAFGSSDGRITHTEVV